MERAGEKEVEKEVEKELEKELEMEKKLALRLVNGAEGVQAYICSICRRYERRWHRVCTNADRTRGTEVVR